MRGADDHRKAGRWDAALAGFAQAEHLLPTQPDSRYQSGAIYEKQGKATLAAKALFGGLFLDRRITQETHPYWLFRSAKLLWEAGEHAKAVDVYNRGIWYFDYTFSATGTVRSFHPVPLPPESLSCTSCNMFLALCEVGMAVDDPDGSQSQGDVPDQDTELRSAIALDPSLAKAHFYRAYSIGPNALEFAREIRLAIALGNADVAAKVAALVQRTTPPKNVEIDFMQLKANAFSHRFGG